MSDDQAWYRQPETFIAVAALVVSISAVVVGIYEASLQRAHDRAEVWPHLELETFITPEGASLYLENTGIGPAVVQSVDVAVDGRRRRNWEEVVRTLVGRPAQPSATETVVNHALRAGERVPILSLDKAQLPVPFWPSIARVGITVCYRSVFSERWQLTAAHMGTHNAWRDVTACPPQRDSTDF
jgi:hypothetical protein